MKIAVAYENGQIFQHFGHTEQFKLYEAVTALPHLDLALGEDLRHLHIVQQGTVALLMMLFNGGYQAETLGQLMETLLVGGFGKAVVHIRPLVVLALSGGEKVFGGVANAVQLFEPQLGVFLLIISGFEEQRRDLLVAFLCVSKVI